MPTLNNIGTFNFDENVKDVPEDFVEYAKAHRAIDVLIKVFKNKFERHKLLFDSMYFLDGRTGSGKSTLMITEIYMQLLKDAEKSILCVEPRVALAKSNAYDICRYVSSLKIGSNVGIYTGNLKIPIDKSGISYCTSAILSQMIRTAINDNSPKLITRKYRFIVIDEVHTLGSPEIALLYNIKEFLMKFNNHMSGIIFIFTSATINIAELIRYYFFNADSDAVLQDHLMIGHVKGSVNFHVDEYFITKDECDLQPFYEKVINACVTSKSTIKSNGKSIPCRDALVFCYSMKSIEFVAAAIEKCVSNMGLPVILVKNGTTRHELDTWREKNSEKQRVSIIEYASSIASCAQEILTQPIEPNLNVNFHEMRIIVSTNVIESGKTISTLYACIDNGLHLKPVVNPLTSLSLLVKETNADTFNVAILPIDEFMMIQRFGRVGREAPGRFYHFYTKQTLKYISKTPIPEFQNTLNVYEYILPTLKPLACADIVNKNLFVEVFGTDTAMYTNYDMVNANAITANGTYYNISFLSDVLTNKAWIIVAQYLYIVLKYNLLDALVLASINRKSISSSLTVTPIVINRIKITRKELMNGNIDSTMSDYIKEAYDLYKSIKYDINIIHYGFPYYNSLKILSFNKYVT